MIDLQRDRQRKLKVLVTRKFPGPIKELLSKFDLTYIDKNENLPHYRLKSLIKDKHGILCSIPDRIDKDIIGEAKSLRVISTFSVGYDHIDIKQATERGIAVTNTPDVLTDATADLTFALILGVARRIVEGHELVKSRRWKDAWSPSFMVGSDLSGRVIGILGMGRIGKAVASRAKAFGMNIIYHSRHRLDGKEEQSIGARYRSFENLLTESDLVSIHLPLTKETHHLINAERIDMMKTTAFLINVARGPIVDEDALVDALQARKIAGAGLDVFEKEPLPDDSPLLSLDNVLLTPHIGSAAERTRYKMGELAAKNLVNFLLNEKPSNIINPAYSSTK